MKLYLPIVLLTGLTLTACADNTPGGKAVRERHEHFEQMSKAFKGISDQFKEKEPDLVVVQNDAAKIADLASQLKNWFPAGSGPQDGKRTDAKAEVWTKPTEFQQAATRLSDAANVLKGTAETGNVPATAAEAKTLGAACKGCHDKFKSD